MSDSEKLTALKKAYADVILNTAKEAAARIMASERKAQRYQQELYAAKDEALRMLLRLKQMLDAKINEADKVTMDQQKRIEELEAQLGEAEDIVRDLRAELREAQDELETVAKERMRSREESTPKDDESGHVENLQERMINNFEPEVCCLPRERSDVITALDVKIPVQNEYMSNHCSCKDNCYVCNPDFASIVMRRREPDGYRNGCTQRILALERCLFGEKLPSKKEDDDKNSSVRDGSKEASLKLDPSTGIIAKSETKASEIKVTQRGKSLNQLHVVNSFPRKKKRAARLKKNKVLPFRNIINQNELMYQGSETNQESELLCHETIPYDVQNSGLSVKDSRLSEKNNHNDHQSSLSNSLAEADVTTQSTYESSEGTPEISKAHCFHVDKENGTLSTGEDELVRHRSQSTGNSEFQSSEMDLQTVEVVTADSDIKTTETTEEPFSQPKYNNSIKYTFQRKRKKEPLTSPDKHIVADNDTPQKMAREKQDVLLDSQETSLTAEPSRDSRRLAQVARQPQARRWRHAVFFKGPV